MKSDSKPLWVFLVAASVCMFPATPSFGQVVRAGCINTHGFVDPFYGSIGTAAGSPINIDLGINGRLAIGTDNSTTGGFSLIDSSINGTVVDGCSFSAGEVVVGLFPDTEGELSVAGPTPQFTITGPLTRLFVGQGGPGAVGRLRVEEGGFLDAGGSVLNCPADLGLCNSQFATLAGNFAFVEVTGPGSRLDATPPGRFLGIAGTFSGFPEAGGSSRADVRITNGGVMNSGHSQVSSGTGGPFGHPLRVSDGYVLVEGMGSQWNLQAGSLRIAGPNVPGSARGLVEVCDGGEINADLGVDVMDGGVLQGNGLVNGNVFVGVTNPAVFEEGGTIQGGCSVGTLSINGDLNLDAGVIVVEAEGSAQFDVLDVSGSANIGPNSVVRFAFSNGYAPLAGDDLPFIQASSINGLTNLTVETENLLPGFEFELRDGSLVALNDAAPSSVSAVMDFKPRSSSNKIWLRREPIFAVAILSTDDQPIFDATKVDPKSIRIGPRGARPLGRRGVVQRDVDRDGDLDLLVFVGTRRAGMTCGDTSISLSAMTFAGSAISATDSIETIRCRNW